MTPTEALSTIYAMRESIANGWKPNQDQELALALADMLDEAKVDAKRYLYYIESSPNGEMCFMGECYSGKKALDSAIDAARNNHEPL